MKKLIIITENYPYSRGELPFLLPELRETMKLFEITIVCRSPLDTQEYSVPDGIQVLHYKPSFPKIQALKNAARCLFSLDYYRELFDKKNPGTSFRGMDQDIRNVRLNAIDLWRWMREKGLFKNKEDSIYYSFWCNESTLALAYEKRRDPSMKIITRAHGYDLFNERCLGGRQPYKRVIDHVVDRIFFVSEMGREYYLNHFAGQSKEHYVLSHLGVDDNGLSPQNAENCLNLFSCSNLVDIKRIDLIIGALSLLDNCSVCWTHAGGGVLQEQLSTLAQEKLASRSNISFHFMGAMANDQILRFYQQNAVDLFITASQTEGGVPVSIMEAFSFGVPAVATCVGGIPEIADSQTGFLLSANPTESEIAHALSSFAQMTTEQKQLMKNNARQKWCESYCAETNHKKFAQMLQQL